MPKLVLVLGNRNYSSWSMRAWLLLTWLDYEFEEIVIPLYRPESRAAVLQYSPTGLLPALVDGETRIWDTFAIILHVADRHPELWPAAPAKRAFVRSICAEMHAGFTALRNQMPHNGRARDRRVPMTTELRRDTERIAEIWSEGRERYGSGGPWLAGEFGIADIMYAPVAGRFRTYGVVLDGAAETIGCGCSSIRSSHAGTARDGTSGKPRPPRTSAFELMKRAARDGTRPSGGIQASAVAVAATIVVVFLLEVLALLAAALFAAICGGLAAAAILPVAGRRRLLAGVVVAPLTLAVTFALLATLILVLVCHFVSSLVSIVADSIRIAKVEPSTAECQFDGSAVLSGFRLLTRAHSGEFRLERIKNRVRLLSQVRASREPESGV